MKKAVKFSAANTKVKKLMAWVPPEGFNPDTASQRTTQLFHIPTGNNRSVDIQNFEKDNAEMIKGTRKKFDYGEGLFRIDDNVTATHGTMTIEEYMGSWTDEVVDEDGKVIKPRELKKLKAADVYVHSKKDAKGRPYTTYEVYKLYADPSDYRRDSATGNIIKKVKR